MDKMQKQYSEFQKRFKAMSDEELIDAFNGDVGNPGWVAARAQFHCSIHQEFENRGFDYSDIGNKNTLSWRNKIKLIGKKIIKQTMKNSINKSHPWGLPSTLEGFQQMVEQQHPTENSSTSETPKAGQPEAMVTLEVAFVPNKPQQPQPERTQPKSTNTFSRIKDITQPGLVTQISPFNIYPRKKKKQLVEID